MKCSLGNLECLLEARIAPIQADAANRAAKAYDVDAPMEGRKLQVPAYPYVFKSMPEIGAIRLEMGKDSSGWRVFAVFTLKPDAMRNSVLVHIAVYRIDETATGEHSAVFSADERHHAEAWRHFRAVLLGKRLGENERSFVAAPKEVPPEPEDALTIDDRLREIDQL
jgi:hypothetical protein